jgi:hypothetical protein
MVLKESGPTLTGRTRGLSLPHILLNGTFGNFNVWCELGLKAIERKGPKEYS